MKNVIFFLSLILCFVATSVNAQNATRGAKSAKTTKTAPSIANYNFSKARSMDELKTMKKRGISETAMLQQEATQQASANAPQKAYIRRVGIAANIPGNYVVGKTSTPEYNPILKEAAARSPRASLSQPVNIRKKVTVNY